LFFSQIQSERNKNRKRRRNQVGVFYKTVNRKGGGCWFQERTLWSEREKRALETPNVNGNGQNPRWGFRFFPEKNLAGPPKTEGRGKGKTNGGGKKKKF